jgi:hypothetical protein
MRRQMLLFVRDIVKVEILVQVGYEELLYIDGRGRLNDRTADADR